MAGWSAFWVFFAVPAVREVIDRRRRPRLRALIADLRANPVHVPATAIS